MKFKADGRGGQGCISRRGEGWREFPAAKFKKQVRKNLAKKVKKAGTKITLPKEDFKKQVRIEQKILFNKKV